ncbi:MAG: response regulator [Bacteroidota bacterium]
MFFAIIFADQILIGNIFTLTLLISIGLGLNYQIQDGRLNQQQKVRKAEQNLRRLSLVAERTTNGVGILDATGRFEWVNQTFEKISGYKAEEVIGKHPLKILAGPNTSRTEMAKMLQLLSEGKGYEGEILYYNKEGEERWQVMNINPVLNKRGQITSYVAVETNINARKKMENQLRDAKEEAITAAKAKAEFLANMSHEIRTPMNAVIGMTGLLADSSLTEEQKEYVETIRVSGDNLLTVINDILDFSKIDSGKLELERQTFNLVDSIEDVLDMLSTKAQDKHIELMYELTDTVPHGIIGDPTRLNQILVNLVNNAIKFTEHGEVFVQVKCTEHEQGQHCTLEFSVKDTGIGIPNDRLNRLFRSFSQVDASTTRKYGGTGLGLAISKRLVNLMGGEIWVESVEGEGSTFFFTLPVEKTEAPMRYQADLSGLAERGARILLVDDNTTNLRLLEKICRKWGIETVAVSDPRSVSALLEDGLPIDLAILDMQMPHINGTKLAHQIKAKESYQQLPLIMLTSVTELKPSQDRELFSAYLSKPFRQKHLLNNLGHLLLGQKVSITTVEEQMPTRDFSQLKQKILLVEDNLVNQKVALRMFKKLGINADIAGNGVEALKALDNRSYDILFMDMQMPEMDGVSATKEIRAIHSPHFQQPIIIAMTANAMKGDRERCLNAGMNDYLSKPIKLEQLQEMLSKWYEKAIASRPIS